MAQLAERAFWAVQDGGHQVVKFGHQGRGEGPGAGLVGCR